MASMKNQYMEVIDAGTKVRVSNTVWVNVFAETMLEWAKATAPNSAAWCLRVNRPAGEVKEPSQKVLKAMSDLSSVDRNGNPTKAAKQALAELQALGLHVVRYANYKYGDNVRPTQESLAAKTGLSQERVRTLFHVLEHFGWLHCTYSASPKIAGRGKANVYQCTIPAGLVAWSEENNITTAWEGNVPDYLQQARVLIEKHEAAVVDDADIDVEGEDMPF